MKRFLAAGPSSPRGAGQGLWAGAAAAFPGCDSAGVPVARPAGPQVLQRHPGVGRALILLQPRVGCAGAGAEQLWAVCAPSPRGSGLAPSREELPLPCPSMGRGSCGCPEVLRAGLGASRAPRLVHRPGGSRSWVRSGVHPSSALIPQPGLFPGSPSSPSSQH